MKSKKIKKLTKLIHLSPLLSYLTLEEALKLCLLSKSLTLPVECAIFREFAWLFEAERVKAHEDSPHAERPLGESAEQGSGSTAATAESKLTIRHPLDYCETRRFDREAKDNVRLFKRDSKMSFLEELRLQLHVKLHELPSVRFVCNQEQAELLNSRQEENGSTSMVIKGSQSA